MPGRPRSAHNRARPSKNCCSNADRTSHYSIHSEQNRLQHLRALPPGFPYCAFHGVRRLSSCIFCRRFFNEARACARNGWATRHDCRLSVRASWNPGRFSHWNNFSRPGSSARTCWIRHCTRLVASDCLRPRWLAGRAFVAVMRQTSADRWHATSTTIRASRAPNVSNSRPARWLQHSSQPLRRQSAKSFCFHRLERDYEKCRTHHHPRKRSRY